MNFAISWGMVLVGSFPLLSSGCAVAPPRPAAAKPKVAALGTPAAAASSPAPSATTKPSKGCGKPPRPSGEQRLTVGAQTGSYIVSVPKSYDPTRLYPLGFAFHGRNRNHEDCQQHDCSGFQDAMGEEAVLVYMQSLREPGSDKGGWEGPTERDGNLRFFEQVRAQIEAEYCVDERRVFLAGTSSGGNFANLLGCLHGEQFLAIAPVSASLKDPVTCQGAPAALVIHGIDDSHITIDRGEAARDNYRVRSGCRTTTTPSLTDMHARVRAARDQKPSVEVLACVDYEGCNPASALRWCEHSYGGWDNSTHGWPATGGEVIWSFVKSLP